VLASAVGNGGSTGVVPMPLSEVRVSERAAGNDPQAHYATSIICVDCATGELLAAAPDTEVMLPYTRPRAATCTITNVRGTALIL
jgi:hypothetical protein